MIDPDAAARREAYFGGLKKLRENDVRKLDVAELRSYYEIPPPEHRWPSLADAPPGYQFWCVYFMQAEDGGPIKIGHAGLWNVQRRLSTLQIGNPNVLVIRSLMPGGEALERALHIEFKELRLRSNTEWFRNEPRLAKLARAMSSDGADYLWEVARGTEDPYSELAFSSRKPLDQPRLKSRKPPRALPLRGENHEQGRAA